MGLAAHVRSCEEQDQIARIIQVEVVGDEALGSLALAQLLDHRVASGEDLHLPASAGRGELRAAVVILGGQRGEVAQHVSLSHRPRRAADARGVRSHLCAHLGEQHALQLQDFFFPRPVPGVRTPSVPSW